MLKTSIIRDTSFVSPLAGASTLNPDNQFWKKPLAQALILTSLVDAFSILVIYLLVNFSNSGEMLYISKDMELPTAIQSEVLKRATLVKLEDGKIFVENKEIAKADLVATLIEARKELRRSDEEAVPELTIQADRRIKYKDLNQVVLASSHAGFSDIKFAVLME